MSLSESPQNAGDPNVHYQRHGGNVQAIVQACGIGLDQALDFSASLNPLGAPDFIHQAYQSAAADWGRYPDPESHDLRSVAAQRLVLPADQLVFAAGEDELIFAAVRCLVRQSLLVLEPSYGSYQAAAQQVGLQVQSIRLVPEHDFLIDVSVLESALAQLPVGAGVCIGAPNNPNGLLPGRDLLLGLIASFPELIFLIDEAFIELSQDPGQSLLPWSAGTAWPENLVVLRSLTKTHAIPGLRLGFAVASPRQRSQIRASLQSWPISCVADRVGQAIFSDDDSHLAQALVLIQTERPRLARGLAELGLRVFPSDCNFLLCKLPSPVSGRPDLPDFLASRAIAVRSCADLPGLDQTYIRVAVRTDAENDQLLAAIGQWQDSVQTGMAGATVKGTPPQTQLNRFKSARKTPALMIQGCSSSTGKSLLAAAFCRIFHEDGLAVTPYKAQNMSLNARVTADGGEIGVAQYIQAQAAGREPDVRMNPVLLKPHSNTGAKIIVLGKPWGQAEALAYGDMTRGLSEIAFQAYDELAAEADVMVLEGAGSPAEINLRQRDFVNMRAAIHAGARVLLAGDIDRGGVFANFIGHVACFRPDERRHLMGFLVNKFRGDPALLGDAYRQTQAMTGFPVLGTIPYIRDLAIDEEDGTRNPTNRPAAPLRVAVIRLHHVANAQDFDPFAAENDVSLEFVANRRELEQGQWDALILPGSRATVADLTALRQNGMADYLLLAAAQGLPIIGICGGLQMLGRSIIDESSVESSIPRSAGLGLLDIETVFQADKVQSRSVARHLPSSLEVHGYEIRHGRSRLVDDQTVPEMETTNGMPIGFRHGNIWGSYLHGLFENDAFRNQVVNGLRRRRGLAEQAPSQWVGIEGELTRLAATVRAACDMPRIYKELQLD